MSDSESANNNLLNADFSVGQELYWVHGEHHRVAVVVEVDTDRVKLSGMTSDYWISKEAMVRKINKPYPVGRACI